MAERILLIEDDARLAEMVSEYLGEAGFRVSIAAAGRAGLERLAREPFDALVLDLMLPDMDGLEVCREVRAKSDTPVLCAWTARRVRSPATSSRCFSPSPRTQAECFPAIP